MSTQYHLKSRVWIEIIPFREVIRKLDKTYTLLYILISKREGYDY
jgi:hypothetical protein